MSGALYNRIREQVRAQAKALAEAPALSKRLRLARLARRIGLPPCYHRALAEAIAEEVGRSGGGRPLWVFLLQRKRGYYIVVTKSERYARELARERGAVCLAEIPG